MQDLRTLLADTALHALRAHWDERQMNAAQLEAMNATYPPLAAWNASMTEMFYSPSSPLRAVDRERCLIGILTLTGPPPSLAIHVYMALMEGVTVEEVCHIVALSGNYGGAPRLIDALPAVRRALEALQAVSAEHPTPPRVLRAILDAFRILV